MDYFGFGYSFDYDCGDVIVELVYLVFVKSCFIKSSLYNGILLKLDVIWYFLLVCDKIDFYDKKFMVVFWGLCYQEYWKVFVDCCYDLVNVDIGDI